MTVRSPRTPHFLLRSLMAFLTDSGDDSINDSRFLRLANRPVHGSCLDRLDDRGRSVYSVPYVPSSHHLSDFV